MPYCALVAADEEAHKFSVPLEVEANEVAQIFGLLKVYIPREIELHGLSGKELGRGRWSGPKRATPWKNVATPSIPTHAFTFSAGATCT
jgi:hypothetical protein